ncbi:dTDP-4-dehydrorhamnose 3,5-epimerase [Neolewinella lacunae]|uniref:dTDP-4-dehydrorhamnose 3,5-epimerase n=1 Tax=Neolewinella lacunae TaxID=1517758 RepID=A0A923PJV6_9BACT|nr:dTDP-4-dehydrorhamnose 3,5-epimerase [Neolewinella lacunae]MBC6994679.1 dTDP-4-dehydrorhamnose 3,5-epimerase [Neolewinella lacunae]MDN3634551.1 dTDP-4-dehydrorhamnose 3,5-epimerase [Neolewinella lacunae]
MPFFPTPLAGVQRFEPRIFGDERGYFFESYNQQTFQQAGIDNLFVQDNQAKSPRGVLRGMHQQTGEAAQAKLVRVIAGEVFDVVVDLRPGSPTLHQWYGCILSADNQQQLFVPRGCAHGYLVLSETAIFAYKCDNFYFPQAEAGLRYDDPTIGIEWPDLGKAFTVAARDLAWPLLG